MAPNNPSLVYIDPKAEVERMDELERSMIELMISKNQKTFAIARKFNVSEEAVEIIEEQMRKQKELTTEKKAQIKEAYIHNRIKVVQIS